ncbi:MAG: choice-of-anchor D domain-containing protein [Deltaproteobacteria bacterium]|nr:choice-of-anchor D domain-containing protein [Deltaproteobacteria bacterium]
MRRTWPSLLVTLALIPACNCGTKPHTNTTSGIVVLSVNGHDVTEDDTALSFDPACLASSGNAAVGKSFLIKNSGTNNLSITKVALGGANAGSFKITNPPTLPASISAATSIEIDVQFAPLVQGNQSATITVDTDDPNKGEVNVRLTGQGESLAPQPTWTSTCEDQTGAPQDGSCEFLTFADTASGLVTTKPVHLQNSGCATLNVTDISILNAGLPDGGAVFRLHGAPPSAASPLAIPSGTTVDVQLDFAPVDSSTSLADLYITTNGVPGDPNGHQGFLPDSGLLPDGIIYVGLQGTGTQAQVTLTPPQCDFNQTDGGGLCQATLSGSDVVGHFVLQNVGNAAVQVTSVAVPADDGGVFTINLPQPAPFQLDAEGGANATVNFTVAYHPFNGTAAEDLVIATSAGSLTSHLVAGSPAIINVPTNLDFNNGTFDPNQYSSPQTLTVRDTGGTPLIVQTPSFTQESADGGQEACAYPNPSGSGTLPRFALSSAPTFPLTINPSGTTDWTLTHTRDPHIGGQVECTLHIPSNDPATPDALVTVSAATYVNCDPFATFTPTGNLPGSASTDGGVITLDGSNSLDTDANSTPACPNGQSDGLQTFRWTLTVPPGTTRYGTHLETVTAGLGTCASSNDGGCVDLSVSLGSSNFPPYGNSALVNVVVDGNDPSAEPATIKLQVTDTTGRTNTASDQLVVTPGP